MSEAIEVLLRSSVAFILFMIIARILGKQIISQMTLHDFITAISLGSIVANMAFNTSLKVHNFLISLFIFSGIALLSTYLSMKNRTARKWLSGEPTVLIQGGKILEHNMKKIHYNLDNLNQSLREKDIYDIEEVEYCILEADGHVSVLKKPPFRPATKQDVGIYTKPSSAFPVELIMDGEIITKNLKENRLTLEWLLEEIKQRGYRFEDVAYAVRGTNEQLYFDLYQDDLKSPIDKE